MLPHIKLFYANFIYELINYVLTESNNDIFSLMIKKNTINIFSNVFPDFYFQLFLVEVKLDLFIFQRFHQSIFLNYNKTFHFDSINHF
jgi:hypothetical protein